ncbi:S8 family serine peptidase [Thermotoga sp. KOL6]|uniref:S8 family serine peptidase n=1 Tax=Thermotoga sp. KOL6 TaxID=126741 RepID=UPI000C775F31|nr:S8 family serine peptidase [Thermotoga sp. KOL6]PLV59347.1 hypothetical protein AS005_06305 [Thermotoga sp. KOL6]
MKKTIVVLSIAVLLVLAGCFGPVSFESNTNSQTVVNDGGGTLPIDDVISSLNDMKYFENQLVILYENRMAAENLVVKLKGRIIDEIPQLNAILVEVSMSVEDSFRSIKELLKDQKIEGIKAIEPNYIRELEPVIKEDEITKTIVLDENLETFQWPLETFDATEVWQEATGNGVIVAVLDTGVDGTHPDLQGQLVTGYDPVSGNVISPNEDSDSVGHGTHVAGIIAGKRDGVGITGLAYNAKIMPIRIFNPGYVGDFYVADGIVWAVNNGADVLSNSWGGWGYSYILHEAFNYALQNNVVIAVSAGNEKTDQHFTYPAGLPGVIAVGATTVNDRTASFSSRGDYLSVGAPGVYVLSSIPVNMAEDEGVYGLPYAYWDGTSMACPYVSALAALIKEKYPNATPYQIRKVIETTAVDIDEPGYDTSSGYGRINPLAALNQDPSSFEEGSLSVTVTDRAGNPIPTVFVTIKNVETGKTYYAKTDWGLYDGEMDADFIGIEPGTYEVIVGGPDFADMYTVIARIEEEVQETTTVNVTDDSSLAVSLQTNFSAVVNPRDPLPSGSQMGLYLLDYSTFSVVDYSIGTGNLQVEMPSSATPDYYLLYYEYYGDISQFTTIYSEDFESGQIPGDWILGGNAQPFVQSDVVAGGNYALQFGDVNDSQSSWFAFNVSSASSTALSFSVKVSSERGWDFFKVYVDGVEKLALSGEIDWTTVSIGLEPGTHMVIFSYEKDAAVSEGYDTAWVDNIEITKAIILEGEVFMNGNTIPVYGVVSSNSTFGFIDESYGYFAPWTVF